MRTLEEINADLDKLKVRDTKHVDAAIVKADIVLADKLNNGTDTEKWIAKQYQGHLQIVYEFSKLDPIPVQGTFNALEGNGHIAEIMAMIGWPDAACFKVVTDDMMQHFKDVTKLKLELMQLEQEMNPGPVAVTPTQSNTLH